jgi:DNA-binding transcriptional LysR family regulator
LFIRQVECCMLVNASRKTGALRDGNQHLEGVETEVRVGGHFNSNAQEVLRKAACAGPGIATLPSVLTASDIAGGRLVRVLPECTRAAAA